MATSQTFDLSVTSPPFTLNYPFLDEDDLQVSIDGVPLTITTEYTIDSKTSSPVSGAGYLSGAVVTLITNPGTGVLKVTRVTPLETAQTFTAGSAIRAQDLNNNFQRTYFSAEESQDIAEAASVGDILDNSIEGIKLQDNAVTTGKIANLTIRDEDISNDSAFAITGTKIQQANTTTRGTVQLTNSLTSTSEELAASANAVKLLNDALTAAINTIDATQPFTRTSVSTTPAQPINVGEHVTVTAAGVTIPLPTGTDGDTVRISVGSFTNTIVSSPQNIMASASNLTIDVALKTVTLMYDDNLDGGLTVVGWRII